MASNLKDNRLSFNSTSIGEVDSKLDILPIGFVYIQFPNQSAPGEFLAGNWTDITSQYAGLFFRAEGGDAKSFGSGTQAEGLPNISGTIYPSVRSDNTSADGAFEKLNRRGWYPKGDTADQAYFRFNASRSNSIYGASSHVTPVNTSIRIWVRQED